MTNSTNDTNRPDPVEQPPNDRSRLTTASELHDQSQRRIVHDPNAGPKHKRK